MTKSNIDRFYIGKAYDTYASEAKGKDIFTWAVLENGVLVDQGFPTKKAAGKYVEEILADEARRRSLEAGSMCDGLGRSYF